jgi:hypothetical protein
MKSAILILSDPTAGSDEALGRVFNALAAAYDHKRHGNDVKVLFLGAGTRWVAELQKPEHPVHGLFEQVGDRIEGVSCGCADVFGATDEVSRSGLEFLTDNPVPGTSGLPSLVQLQADGYRVTVF